MPKRLTARAFLARYPDDDACLAALFRLRFGTRPDSARCVCPRCGRRGRLARLARLPAYSCPRCGHHLHPTAGTALARARLPAQAWLYAMFVVAAAQPRGLPATALQRRLGVTYKTAWRMMRLIRRALALAVAARRRAPAGAGATKRGARAVRRSPSPSRSSRSRRRSSP